MNERPGGHDASRDRPDKTDQLTEAGGPATALDGDASGRKSSDDGLDASDAGETPALPASAGDASSDGDTSSDGAASDG